MHCHGVRWVGCTLWHPSGSASFAGHAWGNVHCQGPRGRIYALAFLGPRIFCMPGVGQCALPRGRMNALASRRPRTFCVTGAGQCTLPRGPICVLFLGLRLFCVAGEGQCTLPRDRMCTLASLGLRLFCVPLLRGRHGAMCTAKGSDVRVGLPRAPPLLRGRRGTMCIAGCFYVAGVGQRRGTI